MQRVNITGVDRRRRAFIQRAGAAAASAAIFGAVPVSSSGRSAGSSAAAAGGTLKLGDLEVRRMGFGAMRITGDGIWGPPEDPRAAKAVLRRAYELGVNFIDTADAYGPDVSEELIAEALHPYPADLVVATKGGMIRSGPNRWAPNGRPEHLRAACEASLKRLRLEAHPVYQLHAPDREVPLEDSVGALARLQEEGKIRHIGVSNFTTEQLQLAQGLVTVVSVQNRYNVAVRDSDPVLAACQEQGIAFIPWGPLATRSKDSPAMDALQDVAEQRGISIYQAALAWLMTRSSAMLPIPGTSSIDHLEENVAAAAITLTDAEMDSVG